MGGGFGNSTSLGSDIDAPIDVTGGGGSQATTQGAGAQSTGTGSATGLAAWIPYLMVGLVAVGLVAIFVFGMHHR